MRTTASFALATAILLAGCSARQAMPSTAAAPAHSVISPQVIQTDKQPIHWEQFAWGDPSLVPPTVDIITGPDKNMWYTDYFDSTLIKMTMAGQTTAFPLSYNGGTQFMPSQIAVGADGKFYMTDYNTPVFGVATTSGVLTTFPIPSGDTARYNGVTLGPDGNVWFLELGHVAKITTAGVITEYAYPSNDTTNFYGGIVTGPDGNLWATEAGDSLLDKIVPSTGAITTYSLGCSGFGIVLGKSDNDLWVNCGNQLARVTTAPVITHFPTGYQVFQAAGAITVGPDGNPWFVAFGNGNVIGEISGNNELETVYFPPGGFSTDQAITLGPDGNLWALDNNRNVDVYIQNPLNVNPRNIVLATSGSTATITVSEKGVSAWTATTNKASVVTVAQGSSATKFVATGHNVGTARITIADAKGNSLIVSVTVH
jgi:virginiamycin B lyase